MSVNRFLSLFFTLLAAICICSCVGKTQLVAARPGDEAFRMGLKKELSTLNIPVEASTDELARVLNQSLGRELYKGETRIGGLTATLLRDGQITITAADNYLYVTLPIAMSLSYKVFEIESIPFKLRFRVKADVTPDWRLQTEVHYLGLSDLMAEDVRLGFFSFKPRKIVDGVTQPLQRMLSEQINRRINEQFQLRSQVAAVWNLAGKPVLLDRSSNAWLRLVPGEVVLYPLSAQHNRVRLSVGISTFAELVVGPEPAPAPVPQLPPLRQVSTFDKTFRVALNTDLYFRDLTAAVSTLLINKPLDFDGRRIVIKDLELYGNGDKLVVKLQTEGALDGLFYLTARPSFEPQSGTFALVDVDFDMQTRDLLLKSADWLLHGTFRDKLQQKLNLKLAGQMEKTRQMAVKALDNVQLASNVFLKGDIRTLKFSDMIVQKERILIQLYAEGESVIGFR